jgi:hypothetical protein
MAGLLEMFAAPQDDRQYAERQAFWSGLANRDIGGSLLHQRKEEVRDGLLRAQTAETLAQAAQRAALAQREQAAMQEEARVQGLLRNAGRPALGMGATGAVNGALPPELQIGAQPQIGGGQTDYRSLFQQGVPFEKLKQLADTSNLGQSEVARTVSVPGPNGEKMVLQLDKFGKPVGQPMSEFEAAQFLNLGDRQVAAVPRAGMAFQVGMSPEGRDASARGWATVGQGAQRLALDRDAKEQGKWQYDAQRGGLVNMQSGEFKPAMQGGQPIDTKASREAAKEDLQRRSAIENAGSVLKEVQDAKGMVGWNTAGVGGSLAFLPATDARNLGAKLQTIKANLGFDRLQQMRAESPTGGALGQVAVQELAALQATVASLDQMQSPTQLGTALDKIENHYTKWRNVMEQARSGQGGASGGWGIKKVN